MRRGAAASTALAMAALAWLAADHGCRARVVSWFQPWVRSDAWTMGDAQIVTERLRFPEPYPEDGIVERIHVDTPRGSVTFGEAHVWKATPIDLGDGARRVLVDLVTGGNSGFGGTWMVTIPDDAPPAAARLGERAKVLAWGELRAQHEAQEADALGRALSRASPPPGMALAVLSFEVVYLFTNRADTPWMDITGAWDGHRWEMGCGDCAEPIDDSAFAAIVQHVDARMQAAAQARSGPDERVPVRTRAVKPLLDGIAALAQAGLRDRALELARLLFSPDLALYIGEERTPDAFVQQWARVLDEAGVQQAGQVPSSRSALSTARTGEPSNPSSGSGSATSSH